MGGRKKSKKTKLLEFLRKLKENVIKKGRKLEKKKPKAKPKIEEKEPDKKEIEKIKDEKVEKILAEIEERIRKKKESEAYKKEESVEYYDPDLEEYFKKTDQKYQAFNTRLTISSGKLKLKNPEQTFKLNYIELEKSAYTIPAIQKNMRINSQPIIFYNKNVQIPQIETTNYQKLHTPPKAHHKQISHTETISSSPTSIKMRRPCGGRFYHIYHDFFKSNTYAKAGGS